MSQLNFLEARLEAIVLPSPLASSLFRKNIKDATYYLLPSLVCDMPHEDQAIFTLSWFRRSLQGWAIRSGSLQMGSWCLSRNKLPLMAIQKMD